MANAKRAKAKTAGRARKGAGKTKTTASARHDREQSAGASPSAALVGADLRRAKGFLAMLRGTQEGRLFLLGVLGLLALVAEFVILLVFVPGWGKALAQMVAVELFAGREGAIPLAIGADVPPWLAAQVSATQDLVAVALVYPLFLYAIEKYHDRDNLFMRRVRRIDEAAARHRKLVDRWGGFGLAVFMVIPFLVNGPLIGAIAGRLGGIRPLSLIAPVVGATVVSAFAWSYAYEGMQKLFPDFDTRVSYVITGCILGVIVLLGILAELRQRRKAST